MFARTPRWACEYPQAPKPKNPVQRSAAQTEQGGRTGVRLNISRVEAACPAGCPSEQLRKYSDGWIWVRAGTEHLSACILTTCILMRSLKDPIQCKIILGALWHSQFGNGLKGPSLIERGETSPVTMGFRRVSISPLILAGHSSCNLGGLGPY